MIKKLKDNENFVILFQQDLIEEFFMSMSVRERAPISQNEAKNCQNKIIGYFKTLEDLTKSKNKLSQLNLKQLNAESELGKAKALEKQSIKKLDEAKTAEKFLTIEIFCIALGLETPNESSETIINRFAMDHLTQEAIGDLDGQITLISMKPFDKYLKENAERAITIKQLNFTPIRVVANPKNLFEFLKEHSNIKAIGFDPSVKAIDEQTNKLCPLDEQMNNLCPLKERTFVIIYVARESATKETETNVGTPKLTAKPEIKNDSSEDSDDDPDFNPYTDPRF